MATHADRPHPPRGAAAGRRAALASVRQAGGVLAPGCRPRGCRAPARRVRGRRVRYHIGAEPGQINGMRWHAACPHAVRHPFRPRISHARRILHP
ncbi:tryptophan biosynthesis modulator TrpM [Streptomyces sp. NPDC004134]|uniref:tryptophan biosynthesis modulator TrpM n=1 Tax=Streptomyces sp. NPDC004134 TaxID=3364691 RepID=UPI0036C705F8